MAGDKDAPAMMDETQAAEYIGVTYWQLRYWRVNDNPSRPPHRVIGRRIFYTRASLDSWLSQQC